MKEFLKGMSLKKDWKVHLMCLILVLIADGIGKQPVGSGIMKITLLPMLYALVLGMVFAGLKIIKRDMMETASPYIGISVMFLTCRMAAAMCARWTPDRPETATGQCPPSACASNS